MKERERRLLALIPVQIDDVFRVSLFRACFCSAVTRLSRPAGRSCSTPSPGTPKATPRRAAEGLEADRLLGRTTLLQIGFAHRSVHYNKAKSPSLCMPLGLFSSKGLSDSSYWFLTTKLAWGLSMIHSKIDSQSFQTLKKE